MDKIKLAKAIQTVRRHRVMNDYNLFSSEYLWITNKKGEKVKLQQNHVQRQLDLKIQESLDAGKPPRIIILKSRQMGISTGIGGRMVFNVTTKENRNGLVIAHRADSTTALFTKSKYFVNNLDDSVKPLQKASNGTEIIFDIPTHYDKLKGGKGLNGKIKIQTAGTSSIGRSETYHYAHLSEFAFWEGKEGNSPSKQLSGILQSIPDGLDTWVIIESTANGMNDFKTEWDKAVKGESAFTPIFLAWYDHEEYTKEVNDKEYFIQQMEEYERWLYYDLNLPIERVAWWRWAKKNKCNGDINQMKQENPTTPEEAFIFSGTPVFNNDIINKRIEQLRTHYKTNPYKTGYFEFDWNDSEHKDFIRNETIRFVESTSKQYVKVYEERKICYPYVIGGDTKGEGSDFYAATVMDNTSGKRVATMKMQVSNSKPYTWQVYCLGMYYNKAMIGIEMNFNTAPIEELERLNYPHQYMRQRYDEITKELQKRYGWKTDGNTRPLIIDKEIHIVEEHIELFYDIDTLTEMTTFVYDSSGRPDAMSGKHDDCLISDMILNEIRLQQSTSVVSLDSGTSDKLIDKHKPKKKITY